MRLLLLVVVAVALLLSGGRVESKSQSHAHPHRHVHNSAASPSRPSGASPALAQSLRKAALRLETLAAEPDDGPSKLECELCELIVSEVDSVLTANVTREEIKLLLEEACQFFASVPSLETACVNLVDTYSDFLVYLVEEEAEADRVCDGLDFCIVNPTAPRFLHLAFVALPSQMSISWLTYQPTSTSTVKLYDRLNGTAIATFTGTMATYYEAAGYNHNAIMTGLTPNTRYYYVVGDEQGGWSSPRAFVSAPNSPQNFSIAIYGDMGVHNSENTMPRIYDLVSTNRVQWIYHIGDIGYGDDYPGNIYEFVWDQWFKAMETVTSTIPYMVCPGNHEYSCEPLSPCIEYSANFKAYNGRFRMPGIESGSNTTMWFSFDYSYVHFVSISSETDYPSSPFPSHFGDQLKWLANDLARANAQRSLRPWIIVVGHRPIYTSNAAKADVPSEYATYLQASFEELFHKYGVDLYVAGHEHSYERIYPTYRNKVMSTNYDNPAATAYLVPGAGGCIEGLSPWENNPAPSWSAYRFNEDQGYGVLDVSQNALQWSYYSSSDGVLRDSVRITK